MSENGSDLLAAYSMGKNDTGNGGFGGMFGEGLWAIIILAMLGFGNGWGGGFGGGGFMNGALTRAELYDGFAIQNIDAAVRGVQQGICDSTYALNNTLLNGFHGVDKGLCDLGYRTQSGFNALSTQLAGCCCDIERAVERGFCDTNYNMANQTRDIIDAGNANTRAILDFLTNEKIDSLRAENQALRFSASQDRQSALLTTAMTAQTNALIDRIAPYPVPSFNVCAPYNFGGYGYANHSYNNGGCGCC